MEKEYWHLGTTERCTFKLKVGEAPSPSGKPNGELFFTDGITIDNHVYIPLETFCRELHISRGDMLDDDFLEILNKIWKREGIFPIVKMDIEKEMSKLKV